MGADIKSLFDIPDDIHYLNTAYLSPLAKPIAEAGQRGLLRKWRPWEIAPADFFTEVDLLKKEFARLLRPDALPETQQRIAIIPSVSYGYATAMRNIKPRAGQRVVTASSVFPSGYYNIGRLAEDCELEMRVVDAPASSENRGAAWNEAILDAIDEKTALVSLPNVHWADGTRFDLAAIGEKARRYDAWLVVDGSQSVGALPFDLEKIRPDALICAGYKWLFGPYGISLAWYGPRMDRGRPIEENWMSRMGSDDFTGLVNYRREFRSGAARYSMGEVSSFIHVPMMIAALQLVQSWGIERIQQYCLDLTAPFLDTLREMGYLLESSEWRTGHLFGVRFPQSLNPEKAATALKAHKVSASFRGDSLRVSCHLYNRREDLEALVAALGA